MCDARLRGWLWVAVALSFLNHWFLLAAAYPVAAAWWMRRTGRALWPARATCALPDRPQDGA